MGVSRWCLGRVEMSGRRNCEATSRKWFVESMKSRVGRSVGGTVRFGREDQPHTAFAWKAVARIRRL